MNFDHETVTVRLNLPTVLLIATALESIGEYNLSERMKAVYDKKVDEARARMELQDRLSDKDRAALRILDKLFGGNL